MCELIDYRFISFAKTATSNASEIDTKYLPGTFVASSNQKVRAVNSYGYILATRVCLERRKSTERIVGIGAEVTAVRC